MGEPGHSCFDDTRDILYEAYKVHLSDCGQDLAAIRRGYHGLEDLSGTRSLPRDVHRERAGTAHDAGMRWGW